MGPARSRHVSRLRPGRPRQRRQSHHTWPRTPEASGSAPGQSRNSAGTRCARASWSFSEPLRARHKHERSENRDVYPAPTSVWFFGRPRKANHFAPEAKVPSGSLGIATGRLGSRCFGTGNFSEVARMMLMMMLMLLMMLMMMTMMMTMMRMVVVMTIMTICR